MSSPSQSAPIPSEVHFPKLFKTFRMAIQPSSMMIALMAVAVICFSGWLMDFTGSVVVNANGDTEVDAYTADPDSIEFFRQANKEEGFRTGVFSTMWGFVATKLHRAVYSLFELDIAGINKNMAYCFRATVWAVRYHFLYCLTFFIIILAVLAVAGGAICRIAALQFARGEKPGLTEALRFSSKRFANFFVAPSVPLIGIAIFGSFVWLLGFVGTFRWCELIIAFFMPLALLAGVAIALIAIGAIAGFNLMFPAVAYDGCDCFDACARAFHYVYSRPWKIAFYSAIAAVYGAVCYVVVRCFAFLVLRATYTALDVGIKGNYVEGNKLVRIWSVPALVDLINPSVPGPGWTEKLAAYVIYAWLLLVLGLVISFIVSFYFSANTIIYALIRNWTDHTDIEQIYSSPAQIQDDVEVT
jgi:hypothetical protein